jgi:hypothetical protein
MSKFTASIPANGARGSAFVNIVRAYVHGHDAIAFDVKHSAQVAFNVHSINRAAIMSRKPVNFVGAQSWIERILFENFPRLPR